MPTNNELLEQAFLMLELFESEDPAQNIDEFPDILRTLVAMIRDNAQQEPVAFVSEGFIQSLLSTDQSIPAEEVEAFADMILNLAGTVEVVFQQAQWIIDEEDLSHMPTIAALVEKMNE